MTRETILSIKMMSNLAHFRVQRSTIHVEVIWHFICMDFAYTIINKHNVVEEEYRIGFFNVADFPSYFLDEDSGLIFRPQLGLAG